MPHPSKTYIPFASKVTRRGTAGDFSDLLANYNGNYYTIMIQHLKTSTQKKRNFVKFKAFLTAFEDTYKQNWTREDIQNKNDQVQIYGNTTRQLTIGWDTVAFSALEAAHNLSDVSDLAKFCYPTYVRGASTEGSTEIRGGRKGRKVKAGNPIVTVQFANLIQENGYGLMGSIDGISIKPDLEAGFFTREESVQVNTQLGDDPGFRLNADSAGTNSLLLPKIIRLNIVLHVLHRKDLGWELSEDGNYNWLGNSSDNAGSQFTNFPYDADVPRTSDHAATGFQDHRQNLQTLGDRGFFQDVDSDQILNSQGRQVGVQTNDVEGVAQLTATTDPSKPSQIETDAVVDEALNQ